MHALKVKCSNSCDEDAMTCSWTGELGDLKYHRFTCVLELLLCPNKCTEGEGEEEEKDKGGKKKLRRIARRYLQKHQENECVNRPYTCPHCNELGTYLERTKTHIKTCAKIPITCPNSPCISIVSRENMDRHRKSECLYVTVLCCHSEVGCSAELKRRELTEHEADVSLHLETAKATISSLKEKITELRANAVKSEQKLKREMAVALERAHLLRSAQTTFKMSGFATHRNMSMEFKSQPFYTRPRGYKMCIIVEANGVPKVRGGYVSVFAHLMRGEYDDTLLWPMVGTVTFELLNQLGNYDHRKRTCTFPPGDRDNHRVVHQEIAGAGYGCPKFISHAKLGLGSTAGSYKEVQYLKDDAIFLRVSVEAPDPVNHDWLRCY